MFEEKPCLSIELTTVRPTSAAITAVFLDHPTVGAELDGPLFRLAGWLATGEYLRSSLDLMIGSDLVGRLSLLPRPEAAINSGLPEGLQAFGFDGLVSSLGWRPHFTVSAWGQTADGVRLPLFAIEGRWKPVGAAPEGCQPCYVASLGRSGSTHAMRLLSSHAETTALDRYPHEFMQSIWLARHAALSASPAEHDVAGVPSIWSQERAVTPSPFLHADFLTYDEATAYANRSFAYYAGAALTQARSAYRLVGAGDGREPRVFVEKCLPSPLVNLLAAVYPGARFVFLTRHPADIFVSRWSFRLKRRDPGFGFEAGALDPIGIVDLALECEQMASSVDSMAENRRLIVRYEDLIADRGRELARVQAFLALATAFDPPDEASDHSAEHRTSTVDGGVGRWRSELPNDVATKLSTLCSAYLRRFGYSAEG